MNQKNRTRLALLQAARELAAEGHEINVLAASERAQISKATAYRYFSDASTLAKEAALDIAVESAETIIGDESNPRKRVHLVTDYYRNFGRLHEPAFRKFLGRLLDQWQPGKKTERRGARRLPALEYALAPVRDELAPKDYRDLILMLASCGTGFEQHIAFTDICGLNVKESDRLARMAVDAMLDRYGIV